MDKRLELRFQQGLKPELRAGSEGELPLIHGYAAKFNEPTIVYGYFDSFVEIIEPGYFDNALAALDLDCRCLGNHNPDIRLARLCPKKDIRTLSLSIDEIGLRYEFRVPNTTVGKDMAEDVRVGNLDGCSFAHYVEEDEWRGTMNGLEVRRLKKCYKIDDICMATYPMYENTTAQLRSDPRSNIMKPEDYDQLIKQHKTMPLELVRWKNRIAEID